MPAYLSSALSTRRAISRCRSLVTARARCWHWANVIVRCSAVTRKWWKKPLRRRCPPPRGKNCLPRRCVLASQSTTVPPGPLNTSRSEEHTSELQSRENLVCRLLLEKKNELEK